MPSWWNRIHGSLRNYWRESCRCKSCRGYHLLRCGLEEFQRGLISRTIQVQVLAPQPSGRYEKGQSSWLGTRNMQVRVLPSRPFHALCCGYALAFQAVQQGSDSPTTLHYAKSTLMLIRSNMPLKHRQRCACLVSRRWPVQVVASGTNARDAGFGHHTGGLPIHGWQTS
jgi:hypothetical protein